MEIVILWIVFMVVGWYIGDSRGNGWGGCIMGLLLGPFGWLISAAAGPQGKCMCPHCRERMHPEATTCPHCQRQRE